MPNQSINPESQKIEYKSSWQENYYEWICGYANSKGGKLYIGVNDDGYVVGVKDTRFLLDKLPNQISSFLGITVSIEHSVVYNRGTNIKYGVIPSDISQKPENLYAAGLLTREVLVEIDSDPDKTKDVSNMLQKLFEAAPGFVKQLRKDENYRKRIIANVEKWMVENPVYVNLDGSLEYIWITVDELPYGVSYHGHYYIRSGGTTTELKGINLSRFLLDKVGKKWDEMPAKKADISHAALEYLRENAVVKGRLSEKEVSVSDQTLLKNLNMLTEDGEYTRAAAMLFADPEKVMVGSHIMIGYFAPAGSRGMNKSNEVIYHDEVDGPLILQAEKAIDLLYTKYMKALIDYEGIRRVELFMIPRKAMREILLNAISHKNYASGNPIQIKVYDDHITVMNEGFWPFNDLRVEDVYDVEHSSYRENPLIASGFYRAGEIETWGQGFNKIKEACEAAGTPLPKIKATSRSITVEIQASELYLNLLKRNSGTDKKDDDLGTNLGTDLGTNLGIEDGISGDNIDIILEFCKTPRSKVEIQERLNIKSERYVRQKLIIPLIESGRLLRTIPDKPRSSKQKYITNESLKK